MQRERAQATGSKRVQASNSAPSLEAHAELLAVLAKPCNYPHEQPYNSVDKPIHRGGPFPLQKTFLCVTHFGRI